jgi:nitrite reductase/ring-hydroxylating ferredoxin subunit
MPSTAAVTIPIAELSRRKMIACTAAGREILVCLTKEGVFALDNICTHAHARLDEGRLRGHRIICPLHGAAFDVRSGAALGSPATVALTTYPASTDGALVTVVVANGTSGPR